MKTNLNYAEVPFSIEEDINKDYTTWANGKCVKFEDERCITYYVMHEYDKKVEQDQEGKEFVRDVCYAVAVRIEKGAGTDRLHELCATEEVYAAVLPLFEADNIELMRDELIQRITVFDKSDRVNCFYLDGKPLRLDKDTRVGLMNSTVIQKNRGEENTVLWFDDVRYVIPVDLAIQMLSELEMFLLEGYNVTATHKKVASALKESFETYDYTKGYPENPVFTTSPGV